VCSPVVGNGLYFTIIDGLLRCIEPATGEVHWTQRLGATDYWASLVAGDDKVYALSGDGKITTVAMDPSACRILSESAFDETCMATPALVEGCVILRTENHLYCFAEPDRCGCEAHTNPITHPRAVAPPRRCP
jgi:outer membrane protein assembly factor BamB